MNLRPCTRCRFNTGRCEEKEQWRAKLKGAGLTVAGFICKKQHEHMVPGMDVRVTIKNVQTGETSGTYYEEPEPIFGDVEFDGTIMCRSSKDSRKVQIWVHDPEGLKTSGPVNVFTDAVQVFHPSRKRKLCGICYKPLGVESTGWVCYWDGVDGEPVDCVEGFTD